MKRIHIATLGLTLAAASIAVPAFAQAPAEQAQVGPTAPVYTPPDGPADAPPAPAYTTPQAPAPVVEESTVATEPMQPAPPATAVEPADAPHSRRDAPDTRHDPNPQTGQLIGHGLFDTRGPNDFGA
jgi:hypothetical protein